MMNNLLSAISDLLLSDGSEYETEFSDTDDGSTSTKSTPKSRYNFKPVKPVPKQVYSFSPIFIFC